MALFDRIAARPLVHLAEDDVALVPAASPIPQTPVLDKHLENMAQAAKISDLLKQAASKESSSMDPITIANLVIMGLGLIADLIKTIRQAKEGGAADDAVFDHAGSFLAKVGTVAKVKELNTENIAAFMPAIKDLIGKVHELRMASKD